MQISAHELQQIRRVNRILDWMPRIRLRGRFDWFYVEAWTKIIQTLIRPALPGVSLSVGKATVAGRPPVGVRIFRPEGICRGVFLDIHGGAFVIGSARFNDRPNYEICHGSGFAVVSVDYRLAGWNPYGVMAEDCETAALWLLDNVKPLFGCEKVVIGGESAGAYLAVLTLLRLRDRGLVSRVAGALLYYGIYDLTGTPSFRAATRRSMMLHIGDLLKLLHRLLPGLTEEQLKMPELSPLYADLMGMPPAFMAVGAWDALRDDSALMADCWPASVEYLEVEESPHGFQRFPTDVARRVKTMANQWLQDR